MKQMIACCGLDCSKCDAYLATIHNDQSLREKTAKLWSKLNGIQILPEQVRCEGCRMDGIKTVFCQKLCAIRQCALKKCVEICAQCPDMDNCKIIQAFFANNPQACSNLKEQKS